MMGEHKVTDMAQQQFEVNKWSKYDGALEEAGGHMTIEILRRFYPDQNIEEVEKTEEQNQYTLLTNYIDKYQERLGLYGTKSKKSEVEKVLAFTHKDLARKANEVYIDYESFKQAKLNLMSTSSVRSTLRDNCIKRGFPQKVIDSIAPTQISMRAITSAVKNNKKIRQEMANTFKRKGDAGYDIYNVRDQIEDVTVSNINENNKELVQKNDEKE